MEDVVSGLGLSTDVIIKYKISIVSIKLYFNIHHCINVL